MRAWLRTVHLGCYLVLVWAKDTRSGTEVTTEHISGISGPKIKCFSLPCYVYSKAKLHVCFSVVKVVASLYPLCESRWVNVKIASVEWTDWKCSQGLGLNADFGNTLKIVLCCGKKWFSGYLQTHGLSRSQLAGMKAAITCAPAEPWHCTRMGAHWPDWVWEPLHARPAASGPKITSPCTGRPWKPNSFPATRQKRSLFHHRKGENILTNACVLDGWQSCHGKEAAAPFGDGRWGAGSGNFWALLAAQVWRWATDSPLLAADHCLNTSRLTPNAQWLLRGSYETNLVFGDLSLLERLHNPYSPP